MGEPASGAVEGGEPQDQDPARAAAGGGPLAVGFIAFVVYVSVLAPAPYLLDSAELAAASFGLGIAHPPGEPLALVLGRLFSLLPLGSVAFRVGLLQAVAGAIAATLVHRLARRLIGQVDPTGTLPPVARHLLAATAALGFALAPGTVISSNRPEVYALGAALALGALLAALRARTHADPRPALLAAFLIGLGLGNHPLVAGLTGVAVALACVGLLTPASTAPRFLGALIGGSIAALLAGALVLLYLPVRAAALLAPGHADVIAWGDARHLGGLWALLSARTFTAKAAIVHTSASPEAYPFVLFDELGAVAPLLALAGIFFGLRTRAARVPVAAITLFTAAASVGALAAGFDPLNPDIRGYLLGALASFAVLAAVGWAALIAGLAAAVPGHARVRTGLAAAVPAAVFLFTVLRALPLPATVDLSDRRAADQAVEDLQSQLPPRAALATVHFETAFLLAYQRTVEGRRPDLAWVHLGFVRGEGYAARLRLDHPSLIPLLDSHARGPLTLDAARASARPLAFEPDDHLAPDLSRALRPQGSAWVLPWSGHASVAESPAPLWPAWTAEAVADRQVRGFLAHRALRDAALACRRGLPITARLRLAELASLVPHDLRARAVRAGCPIAAP